MKSREYAQMYGRTYLLHSAIFFPFNYLPAHSLSVTDSVTCHPQHETLITCLTGGRMPLLNRLSLA